MKIKYTLTFICVTLTLVFLLVSCADDSRGTPEYTGPFEASNVSARQCNSSVSPLSCFISVWNTENTGNGASATNEVKLPLVSDGTYDFYVNWGDESDVQNITSYSDATHAYASNGEYTIYITGEIKGWKFGSGENNTGDAIKLLDVEQWGTLSLGNTDGRQFQGASNFNPTATDAPDLSETTDLSYAFASASNFNTAINNWDVSKVTTMSAMFHNAIAFNQDISGWKVSAVTKMNEMFNDASNFNNGGKALNWGDNTSSVVDMASMFAGATSFNQDISGWKVAAVTKMNEMFNDAGNFNNGGKALNWGDNTSSVVDMASMFAGAPSFNQDISGWSVVEVTTMQGMFAGATNFTSNISGWNVAKVTSYESFSLHSGLIPEHIPFKFRDPSTVSKQNCASNPLLRCFISVWNTANLSGNGRGTSRTSVQHVVLPITKGGEYDFYVDWGEGTPVEHIDSNNLDAVLHEYSSAGTYTIFIAGTIKGWNFAKPYKSYDEPLKLLDVKQWGSLSLGSTAKRQFQGTENFNPTATDAPDLSETTDLTSAFAWASNFNADISDWDVSKVTDMHSMFEGATSFNNGGKPLDWGEKTSNVIYMSNMFEDATAFDQDISGWDVSEVISMDTMFSNATSFNQDISEWDVREVTSMTGMFSNATSFNNGGKPLDWGEKTSNVTDMSYMFNGATEFNQNLKEWVVSKVTVYTDFADGSKLSDANKPAFKPQ